MQRVISVFGGSAPREGEPAYEVARELGARLARAGFTVATGAYMGTMEAASRGAAEAGGHVIGVGSEQIERFRQRGPNRWVAEIIRYENLRDRMLHLVMRNDGMVVLPGGIGTLSEMALAWSLLQVGEITPRPLVLLGDVWRATMAAFIDGAYVSPLHEQLLRFAITPEEAVDYVVRWPS